MKDTLMITIGYEEDGKEVETFAQMDVNEPNYVTKHIIVRSVNGMLESARYQNDVDGVPWWFVLEFTERKESLALDSRDATGVTVEYIRNGWTADEVDANFYKAAYLVTEWLFDNMNRREE